MKRIVIATVALVGLAACDRCYGLRLESTAGERPRWISRDYVRTYGCGELGEMRTIDDMPVVRRASARRHGRVGCHSGVSAGGDARRLRAVLDL